MERLKEGFLARVNHELRIPLTPAFVAVTLLESSLSDVQSKSLCKTLRQRLMQLKTLVEDLLSFSDMKKMPEGMPKARVNVKDLIEGLVQFLRPEWEKRKLTVEILFEPSCEVLLVNPALLSQALKHLLLNAIQFNRPAGAIRISAGRKGPQIHISFSDGGIGIPQDKLSKIFDSFYQVADYLTREVGGLGLGLTIARRASELHGGSILVNSQDGKGSTFTIVLPEEVIPRPDTVLI